MRKLAGVLNTDAWDQLKLMVVTREANKAEADALFGQKAVDARKKNRELLKKLFVQADAAQTMAPTLQKESAVKNLRSYFEKQAHLPDVYRRYPELLKAAARTAQPARPAVSGKRAPGTPPVQTPDAGGSA